MKKKLLMLALIAATVTSSLTGCGGSSTMTVSEMLEAVLEDNGGKMILYESSNDTIDKAHTPLMCYYDGVQIESNAHVGSLSLEESVSLGELAQGADPISDYEPVAKMLGTAEIRLITDSTGNAVESEIIYCLDSEYQGAEHAAIKFGEFERVQIYDQTFMVFKYSKYLKNYDTYETSYTIIPDTKSTKDKTIVLDKIGTEGLVVD